MRRKRKSSIFNEDAVTAKKLKCDKIISLEKMSLTKVAIRLWNEAYPETRKIFKIERPTDKGGTITYINFLVNDERRRIFKKIMIGVENEAIHVPFGVFDLIENRWKTMIKKIQIWVEYHRKRIFFDRADQLHALLYLNKIVWTCDGDIDYLRTATSMLSLANKHVTLIEKCRILSTYCMEEEMMKLKLVWCVHESGIDIGDHPLLQFWNNVVKYDLPTFGILRYITTQHSVESKMITMVDNVHALRYFWGFLNDDEKIRKAVILVERHGLTYQNFLLEELDVDQLDNLFDAIGPKMIVNYARNAEYLENASLVWLYTKQRFTAKQYLKMILTLKNFNNDFFAHVWITTPERLKRYVLIENKTFLNTITEYPNVTDFKLEMNISALIVILPDLDSDTRENIMNTARRWPAPSFDWSVIFRRLTIRRHRGDLMIKFLRLCIANENEMNAIAKKWINSGRMKQYCLYLMRCAEWKALDEFLDFYKPPIEANVFKMKILKSEDGMDMCINDICNDQKYNLLNEVVDHVFACRDVGMHFKKEILTSDRMIGQFYYYLLEDDGLDKLTECVAECRPVEKYVKLMRKKLIQFCANEERLSCLFQFNTDSERCLRWLFDSDEEQLEAFKGSINNDQVFFEILNRVFSYTINWKRGLPLNCSPLDSYLNWYFNRNSYDIKKFKLDKVSIFHNIENLKEFFEDCPRADLAKILEWFYDYDKAPVKKYISVIKEWCDEFDV